MTFGDHIGLCVPHSMVGFGEKKHVNTGTMDVYLKDKVKRQLLRDGVAPVEIIKRDWETLSKGVYARDKAELCKATSHSFHLLELGLQAVAPLPIHITQLDCMGEVYLLGNHNDHVALKDRPGNQHHFPSHTMCPSILSGHILPSCHARMPARPPLALLSTHAHRRTGPTECSTDFEYPITPDKLWIHSSQMVVLDTHFTRNPRDGKYTNVGDTRGLVMLHSVPHNQGRRKAYVITHKMKNGEAGHWMKGPWLEHHSTTETNRGTWAPAVGTVGVVVLAMPLVAMPIDSLRMPHSSFEHVLARIMQTRGNTQSFKKMLFQKMMPHFPHPDSTPKDLHGIELSSLWTCSMHGRPPNFVASNTLSLGPLPNGVDGTDLESDGDDGREKIAELIDQMKNARVTKQAERYMAANWAEASSSQPAQTAARSSDRQRASQRLAHAKAKDWFT